MTAWNAQLRRQRGPAASLPHSRSSDLDSLIPAFGEYNTELQVHTQDQRTKRFIERGKKGRQTYSAQRDGEWGIFWMSTTPGKCFSAAPEPHPGQGRRLFSD